MAGRPPTAALVHAAPVAGPPGAVDRAEEIFRRAIYAESHSLTDAFLKLDRDRSGSCSPAELAVVFSDHGVPLSEKELEAIVRHYDANGDGKIDLYELAKMLPTNSGPLGGGRIERGLTPRKRSRV